MEIWKVQIIRKVFRPSGKFSGHPESFQVIHKVHINLFFLCGKDKAAPFRTHALLKSPWVEETG